MLHEPLTPIAAEVPVINEQEPWALRERANMMEHIFGEMERQRDEFYAPAQDASWQIIDRLRKAGVDTDIYEEGLKVANVNSSLLMERFLTDLEERQETGLPRSANTPARLLELLNDLELDVDEQLKEVHQRVVPTGLISIGRKLIGEYLDGERPNDPQPTVRNIVRTIRGYLDSSTDK
jgi:cobalamin biosynthesis Mg chelatase CobN